MSRTQSLVRCAVGAVLAAHSASAQVAPAFEGVVHYSFQMEGRPSEVVQMIKGVKGRQEMEMSFGRMILLQDRSTREAIMLDPVHRTYRVFGGREVPDLPRVSLTRLGGKEHIAGYDCEHFRVEVEEVMSADICAATGLGIYDGGKDMPWLTTDVATLRRLAASSPEFERIMKEGFVPLKAAITPTSTHRVTIMLATSVERKTLDDALFVVPPGYKRIEMPGMGLGRP